MLLAGALPCRCLGTAVSRSSQDDVRAPLGGRKARTMARRCPGGPGGHGGLSFVGRRSIPFHLSRRFRPHSIGSASPIAACVSLRFAFQYLLRRAPAAPRSASFPRRACHRAGHSAAGARQIRRSSTSHAFGTRRRTTHEVPAQEPAGWAGGYKKMPALGAGFEHRGHAGLVWSPKETPTFRSARCSLRRPIERSRRTLAVHRVCAGRCSSCRPEVDPFARR